MLQDFRGIVHSDTQTWEKQQRRELAVICHISASGTQQNTLCIGETYVNVAFLRALKHCTGFVG